MMPLVWKEFLGMALAWSLLRGIQIPWVCLWSNFLLIYRKRGKKKKAKKALVFMQEYNTEELGT